MITQLRQKVFENGDILAVTASADPTLCGLTVFWVTYFILRPSECDQTKFDATEADPRLIEADAVAAFETRSTSKNPCHAPEGSGDAYNTIQHTFSNLLSGRLGACPSTDWAEFAKLVTRTTFDAAEGTLYDGRKIIETLEKLKTVSKEKSLGLSEVTLEIPAWKLFQIMTAYTALGLLSLQRTADTRQEKVA